MNATKNPRSKKTTGALSKKLSTVREGRTLKSAAKAKIANKSDLIRAYLQKGYTPSEIKTALEKRGLSIYPSEIYRVKQEFN